MAETRPKLAVVYDGASITPLEVAEAARPLCSLIWVLDFADPLLAPLMPLLRRLGKVIDTGGLSDTEVVAEVALDRPDGVITFAEQRMPLAASIAAELGLHFHSVTTAELLINKYRQRLALGQAGVPAPGFWPVSVGADAATKERLASQLRYPVVVKPQEGRASRNTSEVFDAEGLLRLLDDETVPAVDMLVEELLAEGRPRDEQRFGETLMVDSLVSQGRVTHYVVTGHFIPAPPFRGTGTFLPIHLDAADTQAVLDATDAALAALGIDDGFANTDLILTPDGPRVLEVNGRIGGEVHTLLELAGVQVPLLSEAMKFALGAPAVDVTSLHTEKVAFCANYQPPMEAQRLIALRGLDQVSQLSGVTSVVPRRQVGDTLDWRDGTMSRLFTVYGVVADHDQLYELHSEIDRCVVADYELGEPAEAASIGSS